MSDILNVLSQDYSQYTQSHKAVAMYIMDNFDDAAFKTLEEIASDVGVSTTTVIRFARMLGYDGYTQMQKAIQNEMRNKAALPERINNSEKIPNDEILKRSMANDIQNIERTFSAMNSDLLDSVLNLLAKAEKVYILGMRSAFSMAHYTYSRIAQVKGSVRLIGTAGMFYPEEISDAGKGDICIAFLFPRYSKTTANLISYMKKNGVKIILFTSLNPSAVTSYGDIILPCSVKGISYKNSYSAPVSLVNYITAAFVSRNTDKAKSKLTKTEEMLMQGYYLGL